MSEVEPICCCEGTQAGSEAKCQLHLYSPYSSLQIVIISTGNVSSDRFVPHQMVRLADQAMKEFKLDPAQVVWIEHTPTQGNNLSCARFNLIQFDWQGGQATSPHRSPIYEDWYLSWLETEFTFID